MIQKIGEPCFKIICIRCKNGIDPHTQCKCLEHDIDFLLREIGLLKNRVKWLEHLVADNK